MLGASSRQLDVDCYQDRFWPLLESLTLVKEMGATKFMVEEDSIIMLPYMTEDHQWLSRYHHWLHWIMHISRNFGCSVFESTNQRTKMADRLASKGVISSTDLILDFCLLELLFFFFSHPFMDCHHHAHPLTNTNTCTPKISSLDALDHEHLDMPNVFFPLFLLLSFLGDSLDGTIEKPLG